MTLDAFYNIAPGRGDTTANRELAALLEHYRPRVLGLAEAIGYRLNTAVPGYRLLRDTSRPGRANIAAYVRNDVTATIRWTDLHTTWARTDHPGPHPARSILRLRLRGNGTVIVAHAPPVTRPGPGSSVPARREHYAALLALMAPWTTTGWRERAKVWRHAARRTPCLLLCDPNAAPGDPVSMRSLAAAVGGTTTDTGHIEGVVARHAHVTARFVTEAGGVVLRSDHRHALLVKSTP